MVNCVPAAGLPCRRASPKQVYYARGEKSIGEAIYGTETLFVLSAVLGLCSSAYAAAIKTNRKEAGAP